MECVRRTRARKAKRMSQTRLLMPRVLWLRREEAFSERPEPLRDGGIGGAMCASPLDVRRCILRGRRAGAWDGERGGERERQRRGLQRRRMSERLFGGVRRMSSGGRLQWTQRRRFRTSLGISAQFPVPQGTTSTASASHFSSIFLQCRAQAQTLGSVLCAICHFVGTFFRSTLSILFASPIFRSAAMFRQRPPHRHRLGGELHPALARTHSRQPQILVLCHQLVQLVRCRR